MPSKDPMIGVRLSPAEKLAVEQAAARDGRSVSSYVRRMIAATLKRRKAKDGKP
jgi:hypothetical protein